MTRKLSIGFIGTRGIPNEYGGYEAAVQELAPRLASMGHRVVVYCSKAQLSRFKTWNGVELIYSYDPESKIGSAGQFVYDFLSNIKSRNQNHDVIFHMGYTSDSIWHGLWDKSALHVTNMDGVEWRRSKYSKLARKFLKYAERLAANNSSVLIADNKGIEEYIHDNYNAEVVNISYGVEIPESFNNEILKTYTLEERNYDIVVARIVPENNIEEIIKAKLICHDNRPLVIFGNRTNFRDELVARYLNNRNIIFIDGNFNKQEMDSLRHFSRYYIHGHSVGGTNPSLLESMAAKCKIIAHDNPFNRNVLQEEGRYFETSNDLAAILQSDLQILSNEKTLKLLSENHNWQIICKQYETVAYKNKS